MRRMITAVATAGLLAVAGGVAAAEIGGVGPFATATAGADVESVSEFTVEVMPAEHVFEVAEAGTVTVVAADGALQVGEVAAAAGWTAEVEMATGREVEVTFEQPGQSVDFKAELEDGKIEVRVRQHTDAGIETTATTTAGSGTTVGVIGETHTFDVDGAGSVTVAVTADGLEVVAVDAAAGWVAEVEAAAGIEVEVDFRFGMTRTKFEAEIEDGAIKVDIESESGVDGSGSDDDHEDDGDDEGDGEGQPFGDGEIATFAAGAAGTVTVQRTGTSLQILSVDALPGWDFTVEAKGDGEVDVDFVSLAGEIEFSAEVEDGRIEIDLEVDLGGGVDD